MLTSVRAKLFSPPILMAAGLGVFGFAGYAFVALTGRSLSTEEGNQALAFYFVFNIVGPGVFAALEQVSSRTVSRAVASGHVLMPAIRRLLAAGAGLAGVTVVILLALAPYLLSSTLHGDWALYGQVLLTPVILAALSAVRGVLAGLQRFNGYAATMAIEGTVRLVLTGVLALGGVQHAWIFCAAFLGSSVIALLSGFWWLRRPSDGTEFAPVPPVRRALAALAVASLLAQLLPNLAPLVVTSLLGKESLIALAFGQAVVIARLPLLAFYPVQTMLLPSLTAAVTKGDYGFVQRRIKLTMGAVVAFGVVYAVGFLALGPWVLRTFMDTKVDLAAVVMVLLAVSTVVLIGAIAMQPALMAMGGDKTITLGWAVGVAVTLGVALLPYDAPTMASAAQVAGPALTMLVIIFGLQRAFRRT